MNKLIILLDELKRFFKIFVYETIEEIKDIPASTARYTSNKKNLITFMVLIIMVLGIMYHSYIVIIISVIIMFHYLYMRFKSGTWRGVEREMYRNKYKEKYPEEIPAIEQPKQETKIEEKIDINKILEEKEQNGIEGNK